MGDLVVNSGIMRLERLHTHLKAQQAARVRGVLFRRLANSVMQKLQGLAEVDLRLLIPNSAPCMRHIAFSGRRGSGMVISDGY